MKLLDIAEMPVLPGGKPPTNGLHSVSEGIARYGYVASWPWTRQVRTVTCEQHGAMNCVAVMDHGKLWRCLTCNQGAYAPKP